MKFCITVLMFLISFSVVAEDADKTVTCTVLTKDEKKTEKVLPGKEKNHFYPSCPEQISRTAAPTSAQRSMGFITKRYMEILSFSAIEQDSRKDDDISCIYSSTYVMAGQALSVYVSCKVADFKN